MTTLPGANEAFGSGMNYAANPTKINDQSLTEQSSVWNTEVRATIGRPQSVLQPLASSADGMSSQDAARRTFNGEYLGSGNGEASPAYEQEAELQIEDSQ